MRVKDDKTVTRKHNYRESFPDSAAPVFDRTLQDGTSITRSGSGDMEKPVEIHFGQCPDAEAAARRRELFTETPIETLRRWTLGTAWALRPHRLHVLPALGRAFVTSLARPPRTLPDPDHAPTRLPGFCGFVHDLSPETLAAAHRRGMFTFAHFGPLKWMAPPERCILDFGDFHMSKRLRSRLRQQRHRVTFDRCFPDVIKACAGRREGKWSVTWITPKIMRAYCDLHDAGYAHSYEVWNEHGALVGGGYGVAVGGAFTIESQFTREDHTSKIGFAMLNWHLAKWGFTLNDNKAPTRNTLDMGFKVVPRAEFHARLAQAMQRPDRLGPWRVETDLATVAAWQPDVEQPRQAEAKARWTAPAAALASILAAANKAIGERLALVETCCAIL
jgi:leucyl/phenylalanyl-tRNA--protein transferase